MPVVNGFIWLCGTLMYGLIQVLARTYCSLLKIGSAGTPTGCLLATSVLALRIACCLLDERPLVVEVDPLHRCRARGGFASGRTATSVPPPRTPAVLFFASGIGARP